MDYFTKELIVALDKIHAELVKLLDAIENHKNAISEHGKAAKQASDEPLSVVATPSTPVTISKQDESKKYEPVWKVIKNGFEIAGIIAVVVYAILTYFMWHEMQETSKAAKKSADSAQAQLELTDRPWLTITFTPESPGFVFEKDGSAHISLRAHIKNVGRSAANSIVVPLNILLASDSNGMFREPVKRQRELCEKTAKRPASDTALAIVLFPGDSDENQIFGVGISRDDIKTKYLRSDLPAPKDMLLPIIYGCADYRYGTSGKDHQTGFIYEVQWIDRKMPPNIYPIKAIRINKSVSANDVVLQKYGFGGFYAY